MIVVVMEVKVGRWAAILAVCVALLAISLYGCSYFIGMPSTKSKNTVDLQYAQTADYNYKALVEPSLLYNNRTEISEGEPLYLRLVRRLSITLQYNLTEKANSVKMIDTKLGYEASAALSGGDWTKTYLITPTRGEPVNPPSFTETYTLDIEEIEEIVQTIGEETGTRIYTYSYQIPAWKKPLKR